MNKWKLYTAREIKPAGWMKRQLEIQANGLSGNLHKVWPDVRDSAWIGGNCEGWERVPYWLDGFIPLAYLLENEDMIATVKKYINAILSKQEEDGWICPCAKDKRARYDTWAVQLITKTLTVYYECSGDERIPDVIYRILHNYYELLKSGEIKLFNWGKFRWFETFIALNFISERYNEDWLTELAKILKEQGYDYNDAVELWKNPKSVWRFKTHIVNIAMMLKAEAVSCTMLGEGYTDRAEYFRSVLDKYNGTVYESFTGDECLSGISPIQGTELCAIVEQMYSYELLYAFTGENKWAERLEVLAFNALPATLSEDMWSHQYVQMSNQIACKKLFPLSHFGTNGPRAHLFGLEPNFGCCTANFNQGFPKLMLSAFMHKDNAIINAVMLPCRLKDEGIEITLETEYPFKNSARYIIKADKEFNFIIRIPSFAKGLKVNAENRETDGINMHINAGETVIDVEFDAEVKINDRPNGLSSVRKGSLIFSVPIEYKKKRLEYVRKGVERKYPYCDYELIPTGKWNYALANNEFSSDYNEIGDAPFSESAPPLTLKADVQEINWGHAPKHRSVCAKVPESVKPISEKKAIKLIPYGCAKLRITELPLLYNSK